MDNSKLNNLIYRIIGKPDVWHDDYIDVMHQVLNEVDTFDNPDAFSELELGEQLLNRMNANSDAFAAFNALLNKSRFKIIFLDRHFTAIHHNESADKLFEQLLEDGQHLKTDLVELLQAMDLTQSDLVAVDYCTDMEEQLYIREIQHQRVGAQKPQVFYLLMSLNRVQTQKKLQTNLVKEYRLTAKEQAILLHLLDGKTRKGISSAMFISENTLHSHMKSIYRKTDVNSHVEVMNLLLTHESQVINSYFDSSTEFAPNKALSSDEKFVILKRGDKIYYREYGPSDGEPVIVCHNGFGCRVSIAHNYHEICTKLGKRVIIPDRPGCGLSPFIKRHPHNWSRHFSQFVDALGIQQYELLGNVFGCTIALNLAAQADERLTKVMLASPVFINRKRDAKYLTGILAPSARLVGASKHFAREIYTLWLKSVTTNLNTHYRKMLDLSIGDKERELFAQHQVMDLLVDGFSYASRSSLEGIAREMVYCMTPQKLDLSKITIPVSLWWGTQDKRIVQAGVENIAAQLPDATLHIREGYSEHLYYALLEDILSG